MAEELIEGRRPEAVNANESTDRDPVSVSLSRTPIRPTPDQALWAVIRNRTQAIRFDAYSAFIEKVLCQDPVPDPDPERSLEQLQGRNKARLNRQNKELYFPLHGVGAYELLKTATQIFLLLECGLCPDDAFDPQRIPSDPLNDGLKHNVHERERYSKSDPPNPLLFDSSDETIRFGRSITFGEIPKMLETYLGNHRLPYIQTVLTNVFQGVDEVESIFCEGYLSARADCPPLLELIWSYWHEEAMLVQSMKAISLRFQNRRSSADRDPLAHLEIAPLFPLNNMLWGYIQDEQQRLSVQRRAYEYDHHYGLTLSGKAISDFQPADTRSKFLEAYHHLLYLCTVFFKQDDDTTVIADGFPILNALKEVHLLLAEGAHNQFGDLPWTTRAEMLVEQWMLSRPEMLRFLQTRAMVPYREAWMGQVDAMKRLQGWTDVAVTHFNELAIYGEQILLSVRYGDWNRVTNPAQAANWARYWRPEIQNYIHSYRSATGVELRADITTVQQRALITTQPSLLLRQRLPASRGTPALPDGATQVAPQGFRERRAARRGNGR